MLTRDNYAEMISNLTQDEKVAYYEFVAHSLTIGCRSIWSDNTLTDQQKIEGMRYINEILHRIISKIRVERQQLHEWKEEHIIEMMLRYVQQAPHIKGEVACAITESYKKVKNL
ncbi:hypothetical protein [Candidatus Albibeggiatoa sp. nov. NOAA]|uniref:hypothetical protein n=1 Tax=Candidatus Albibeggiatoa sp. nov. NOAA TaxID=3162724 RepID=UPI0033055444|nr:hypothetical protein [Thiotrichaceae bacterium]